MFRFAHILTALALLLALPAPALLGGSEAAAARVPDSPEKLYNTALRQMKRGYYDEAILSFEKVRNHFPFNQYSVLAELRVADCMFEKAAFIEAVDAYRQFARLHPRHPEIDYVVFRTAKAEFKLAPDVPQRDQSHAERGLHRIDNFEARFPDSSYTEEVVRLRGKADRRLARYKTQIGNFYWKQKEWKAAERRYRQSAEQYPYASTAGKARYRRALCLLKMAEKEGLSDERRAELSEKASVAMIELASVDPEGRWGKRAVIWIERGGGVVPEPGSQDPIIKPAVERRGTYKEPKYKRPPKREPSGGHGH